MKALRKHLPSFKRGGSREQNAETTSRTREQLAELDQRIAAAEGRGTTSRTREELKQKEAYLSKLLGGESTTSHTLERIAMLDKQIDKAEKKETSSRSREELVRKKEKLKSLQEESAIGSYTRERIGALDLALKKEQKRAKKIHASAESTIITKKRELDNLREVNARKEVIKLVMRNIAKAQITDLAFLIDCTGSMDAYIITVKNEIEQIVKNIREDHPDVKLNVGFVGYRDHSDQMRIEKLPFTNDYNSFSQFLTAIKADGGGDAAEDVFGGLEIAGMLGWRSPCRILMHFADAPCHGNRFHNDVYDDDSTKNLADRRGLRIENLLSKLKKLEIKYFFGQINNTTDKMVRVFREVAGDPNFPFMINVSDTSKICLAVSESVSTSITTMVEQIRDKNLPAFSFKGALFSIPESNTAISKSSRSLKPYIITKDGDPQWHLLEEIKAKSTISKEPVSFSNLAEKLPMTTTLCTLKIALEPFAEGSQRISYKGLECSSQSTPQGIVLKEFKYKGDKCKDYESVLETHAMAGFLAKEFYRVCRTDKLFYLRVNIVRFRDKFDKEKLYTSERLLKNYEFQKWTNNTSFVSKQSYCDTLHAFSHWTYEKTKGYLMICDLQGVQVKTNEYVLTDPAMHCTDVLRFGTTNLGTDGMKRFFRTHKCNDVCEGLKLENRK